MRYNALHREAEKSAIPRCLELGMGVIVRQPLACGYLSGKYNNNSVFPKDDVRHWQDRDVFLDIIKTVNELKNEFRENIDMAQWSIGWCLRSQNVDSVIVGCKTIDQIRNSVKAVEIYANKHQTV
jgi:aryl-alcohol dehydrogenase-like predicted oxidoreductase